MTDHPSPALLSIRRWVVFATFALVEGIVWLNAYESGVVKTPVFVLGSSFVLALAIVSVIRAGKVEIPLSWISLLVPLHIAMFLLSFWWSFDPSYSWSALAFGVSCAMMFLAGVTTFPTRLSILKFFRIIEWVTAILCFAGALQLIFGDHLPVVFFVDPDRRIPSLLGNSIFFSSYLILVFPVVLSQAFASRDRTLALWARYALLAGMAILLFATQTRSSILACVCSLVLFALLSHRAGAKKRLLILASVVVLGAGIVVTVIRPDIVGRFTRMFDASRESTFARRMYFWKAGWEAFEASPIVGHGLGSFERTVFEYRSPEYWKVSSEDIVPHAHNEVLEIAVEYGAIGLALFAGTFIIVLRRGYRGARAGDNWERWTYVGLLCALVAIAVDNLGNVSLREPPIALPTWMFMGLLWSTGLTQEERAVFTIPVQAKGLFTALTIALWLIIAVIYGRASILHIESEVHLSTGLLAPTDKPAIALAAYELAVREDPSNLLARSRLTQQFLDLGQWDSALVASEALQLRSPMYPQSSLMKSYALLRLGRYRESLEWIGRELRERSHPVAYQIQAEAFRGATNSEGEQAAIRQLLRGVQQLQSFPSYRVYCLRLAALAHSRAEREMDESLLDSVSRSFPADRAFFDGLKIRMHSTER